MNAVTDLLPAIEERAREQMAESLDYLQELMLRSFNSKPEPWLALLMMVHTARAMHDEAINGRPNSDAERWAIFEKLLGGAAFENARVAVQKLLLIKEAHEANG